MSTGRPMTRWRCVPAGVGSDDLAHLTRVEKETWGSCSADLGNDIRVCVPNPWPGAPALFDTPVTSATSPRLTRACRRVSVHLFSAYVVRIIECTHTWQTSKPEACVREDRECTASGALMIRTANEHGIARLHVLHSLVDRVPDLPLVGDRLNSSTIVSCERVGRTPSDAKRVRSPEREGEHRETQSAGEDNSSGQDRVPALLPTTVRVTGESTWPV